MCVHTALKLHPEHVCARLNMHTHVRVCVGKRAHGEVERESDGKQRPLPLIKLRSNYVRRLQMRSWQFGGDVQDEGAQYGAEKERKGKEERKRGSRSAAGMESLPADQPPSLLTQPGQPLTQSIV